MDIDKQHSEILRGWITEYSKNKKPIEVNFKDITSHLKFAERATHSVHYYPAKLIPQIPYFFLNNSYLVNTGDNILDPFMGSGTVLLEAQIRELFSFGSDANPLARLISEVKTGIYDINLLKSYKNQLIARLENNKNDELGDIEFPDVVNIDYWFLPNVKRQLNVILKTIKELPESIYKNFFILCFSSCVKKVSLADERVSVPVKAKMKEEYLRHSYLGNYIDKISKLPDFDVYSKFLAVLDENIKRIENKHILNPSERPSRIVSKDARNLELENNSIDLIITSPPYAGAQKYIRSSSLNLGWTELSSSKGLRELEKQNIGREHYSKDEYLNLKETGILQADLILQEIFNINPLRANIAANYLIEMRQAIKEAVRVLKPNKFMILVAANNKVCNYEFETQEYLRKICEDEGLKTECRLVDNIKSYGLMTKRNKTASIITREWVLILRK